MGCMHEVSRYPRFDLDKKGGLWQQQFFIITPVHLAWQADHLTLPEVNDCGGVSWGDISAYWTFAGRLKNCQMFYWSKYHKGRIWPFFIFQNSNFVSFIHKTIEKSLIANKKSLSTYPVKEQNTIVEV